MSEKTRKMPLPFNDGSLAMSSSPPLEKRFDCIRLTRTCGKCFRAFSTGITALSSEAACSSSHSSVTHSDSSKPQAYVRRSDVRDGAAPERLADVVRKASYVRSL